MTPKMGAAIVERREGIVFKRFVPFFAVRTGARQLITLQVTTPASYTTISTNSLDFRCAISSLWGQLSGRWRFWGMRWMSRQRRRSRHTNAFYSFKRGKVR